MKNISLEVLLDMARMDRSNMDGVFAAMVNVSRFDCGLTSQAGHISRPYSGKTPEVRTKIFEFLKNRGYIIFPGGAGNTIGALPHPTEDYIIACFSYSLFGKTVKLTANGDWEEAKVVLDWIDHTFPGDGVTISTATGFNNSGILKFDSRFLQIDKIQIAKQSFYPWLSVSLEEYFKAFKESKESVLVMFGPPGTGKSTFLRSLIAYCRYDAYLAYNKVVVESTELVDKFYGSGTVDLLAYEDIDKHMKRREDGNDLMSTLLNASDGVIQYEEKKIVFSTNLSSINQIDKALLRVGRCFDILPFRELSVEEANAVIVETGREPRDFSSKNKWSLAEVLSEQVIAQQTINRFGTQIGFN